MTTEEKVMMFDLFLVEQGVYDEFYKQYELDKFTKIDGGPDSVNTFDWFHSPKGPEYWSSLHQKWKGCYYKSYTKVIW